jgi:hypothetical protein
MARQPVTDNPNLADGEYRNAVESGDDERLAQVRAKFGQRPETQSLIKSLDAEYGVSGDTPLTKRDFERRP